jgi:hypothetical protein
MRHITPWFEQQALPETSRFDAIMDAFWQEARLAVKDAAHTMPEGTFELEQGAARVEGIALREHGVAALRVVRCTQDKNPRVVISELFLARPATRAPVVGVRAWRVDMNGEPVSGGQKQPAVWERLVAAGAIAGARESDRPLPYFRDVRSALTQDTSADATVDTPVAEGDLPHQAELDRDYYRELADSQAGQLKAAEVKLRHLKALLQNIASPETVEEERRAERTLKALPVWAVENESRIVILPRAFAGARRSQYQSDEDIFRVLDFLAGPYRDQRLNTIDTDAYQAALQTLQSDGFRLARAVDPSVAGEQGEAYFVRFGERRRFLEWHLLKGGGRDERYCLRVYFFWDDDLKVAVVGSLPAHLGNSLT